MFGTDDHGHSGLETDADVRRVVADTNVLISTLHRRGTPPAIVDLVRTGEVGLYYLSPFILDDASSLRDRAPGSR